LSSGGRRSDLGSGYILGRHFLKQFGSEAQGNAMTTLDLAIDPFWGYFRPWRQSRARVVTKTRAREWSPFAVIMVGLFAHLLAVVVAFILTTSLCGGLSYLLVKSSTPDPFVFYEQAVWIRTLISALITTNVLLLVVSVLRAISNTLIEMKQLSDEQLQTLRLFR
jgi:hypothetical protein